ncbi:hypothetical protein [Flavobacterium tructae]|uniref:Uncharacterized protein n=1 Tax=Flavobacterium tructae TaxID=1114873 RepID=A0A1S1J1F7_9FLAO|nr:hypothetical protein [Flavobacterium tructae]OHT44437.1 hypothetical protein BHE19_12005 [Flavobacterium tructae]OXB19427.1 hypothetical protein B0A71_12870 [Flavobacterium tructae]
MITIIKNTFKRIIIWWKAVILGYPYYRIKSEKGDDGEYITGFTYRKRAKAIAKETGGKYFIDYSFIIHEDQNI